MYIYILVHPIYHFCIDSKTEFLEILNVSTSFLLRNGLALVFEAQGKLSDAEPLFRRALEGNVAKYGASAFLHLEGMIIILTFIS